MVAKMPCQRTYLCVDTSLTQPISLPFLKAFQLLSMSCPTTIYSNVKANPTFWSASTPLPSIETVNQGNGSVKIFKNKIMFFIKFFFYIFRLFLYTISKINFLK
jgi:hypothetical protein